jgi:hypothetical protein
MLTTFPNLKRYSIRQGDRIGGSITFLIPATYKVPARVVTRVSRLRADKRETSRPLLFFTPTLSPARFS